VILRVLQAFGIFAVNFVVLLGIHMLTGKKVYGLGYYYNRGVMLMFVGVLFLTFGFVLAYTSRQ